MSKKNKMENNDENNDKSKRICLQNNTVEILSNSKNNYIDICDEPILLEKILIYKKISEKISFNSCRIYLDNKEMPKWIRNKVNHSSIELLINLVKSGSIYQISSLCFSFKSLNFAPVNAFKYAPMSNIWTQLLEYNVAVDIKKEKYAGQYWRTKIIKCYGYFMKLCYLSSIKHSKNFMYNNFSRRNLLPIKACNEVDEITDEESKPIQNSDVITVLNQSQKFFTLKTDFQTMFNNCFEQFDKSHIFEVFDLESYSFCCCKIIQSFGDWKLVGILEENVFIEPKRTFWVHPKSGMLRPPGWSQIIGCLLYAPVSFHLLSQYSWSFETIVNNYIINSNCFLFEPDIKNNLPIGSFLELLDPNNHQMKVAIVSKKYNFGFMLLEFDIFDNKENIKKDCSKIVQHITSRIIFPIGYSARRNIPIFLNNATRYNPQKMPKLSKFLMKNSAPEKLFPIHIIENNLFKCGMILETFNMIGEGVISYAIIECIIDRLMELRFINHDPMLKLWVEQESTNIMPFGYTHMINFAQCRSIPLFIDNIRFKKFHIIARS